MWECEAPLKCFIFIPEIVIKQLQLFENSLCWQNKKINVSFWIIFWALQQWLQPLLPVRACTRAGIVAPLTPFGIWSLKWQGPFWKATIKTGADLRSMVTAGRASHLTLISLHLGGLLLGVKSTSYLTSAKSEGGQTPTHNQMLYYRSLLFMDDRLLFVLCCCCRCFSTPFECLLIFGCYALDTGQQLGLVETFQLSPNSGGAIPRLIRAAMINLCKWLSR